ncbi:MAG: hypothetical protein QM673_05685 [Gordonia sp. (in: high G+C Gram-positive bacteria)]
MILTRDERVLAEINAHAVLGALPRLAELAPEAAAILDRLHKPTTLHLKVRGGPSAHYTFSAGGISIGERRAPGPTLLFASPKHFNAVIAGTAQPIPLSRPSGIGFLKSVFTPLTALLESNLRGTDPDAPPSETTTLLTLHVAAIAITIVGNHDESGQFSAAHMADGDLDIEVGDHIRYRVEIKDHRLRLDDNLNDPPRAALRFADLDVAGGILSGRESALACLCDGRVAMRGYIPLVDNTNRILDRVGTYLEA